MVTAAIAKAGARGRKIVGKALARRRRRVARAHRIPTSALAVIGDDLGMDVGLGRLGGSRTVLVRSGMSSQLDLDRVRPAARPHFVVENVAALLDAL